MSAITKYALALSAADKVFGSAVNDVAKGIAQAFGEAPTFDEWEQGADEFKTAYTKDRGCTDATAANRWSFVCKEMESQYGLSKPKKPTQAAQVKQAQRTEKAAKVDEILKTHTTMAEITKAMAANPTETKVYAEAAAKLAAQVQKSATEAAKERTKALKAAIAEGVKGLTLAQLGKVAKLVQSMQPAPKHDADDEPEVTEAIDELEALPVGEVTEADDVNPLTVLADGNPDSPLSAMQSAMAKALAPTMI